MLMDMCLPYLSLIFLKVQQQLHIVLRATQTLDVLIFFKKEVLSDIQSEIRLVRRNIDSTRQSVRAKKKIRPGYNSIQNEIYRKRNIHMSFSLFFFQTLICKLKKVVLNFYDICVWQRSLKTNLETNFLKLENQSFENVSFS